MNYIDDIAAGLYTYDGSVFDDDWNPIISLIIDFMGHSNQRDVLYNALHIQKSTKNPVYEKSSRRVS